MTEIENMEFSFEDPAFLIEPSKGIIWPNSSAEISVTFSPELATINKKYVYCEISGRELRLPLNLTVYIYN